MSLAECQNNPIDVNFHIQESLEIFDKNSADKFWSKKDKGGIVPSLMPIRVNLFNGHKLNFLVAVNAECIDLSCMFWFAFKPLVGYEQPIKYKNSLGLIFESQSKKISSFKSNF